jgi:hypothetical protein
MANINIKIDLMNADAVKEALQELGALTERNAALEAANASHVAHVHALDNRITGLQERVKALESAIETEKAWEERVAKELGLPENNRAILGGVKDLKIKCNELERRLADSATTQSMNDKVRIEALLKVAQQTRAQQTREIDAHRARLSEIMKILDPSTGTFFAWDTVPRAVEAKIEATKREFSFNVQNHMDARHKIDDLDRQLREVRSVIGATIEDHLPTLIMKKFGDLADRNASQEAVILEFSKEPTTVTLDATRKKVARLEAQIEKFKEREEHGVRWENSVRTLLCLPPAHTPGVKLWDAIKKLKERADQQQFRADAYMAALDGVAVEVGAKYPNPTITGCADIIDKVKEMKLLRADAELAAKKKERLRIIERFVNGISLLALNLHHEHAWLELRHGAYDTALFSRLFMEAATREK